MTKSAFILFAMLGAAWLAPGQAHAYDGCVLYDSDNLTGTGDGYLFPDDVTLPTYAGWGPQTARSKNSTGLHGISMANKANSVWINAGLTDVHLYLYMNDTYSPPNKYSSKSDLGGSGSNYMGGVMALRCPKGNGCSWNLNGYANKNVSAICQREFYNNVPFDMRVPFKTGPYILSGNSYRQGLADELKRAVGTALLDYADGLSDEHAYAVPETLHSYCTREGKSTTAWPCNGGALANENTDLIRLHYDARVNVDGAGTTECIYTSTIVGVLSLGLLYDATNAVCEAIAGEYRVTIDTWLNPYNAGAAATYPLNFGLIDTYVSANPYSGAMAGTVVSKLKAKVAETDPAATVRTGLYLKIGQQYCDMLYSSNYTAYSSQCLTSGRRDNVKGAQKLFQSNDPGRVQLSWNVHNNTGGTAWAWFPASGVSTTPQSGRTGMLDLHFGRGWGE